MADVRPEWGVRYTMQKKVVPDGIYTDDKQVLFHYSARKANTLGDDNFLLLNGKRCGIVLDSISLHSTKDIDNRIQSTRLSYGYYGSSPRMFLTEIANSKDGRYSLSYNVSSSLPNPRTISVDYWGYWKTPENNPAKSDNRDLLPSPSLSYESPSSENYYGYISNEREPTGKNAGRGLLSSIKYPTGTIARVLYESHTYSRELTYAPDWSRTVNRLDSIHIAGGARVKEIAYYRNYEQDSLSLIKKTTYTYASSLRDFNNSGMLMYMPRYYHQTRIYALTGRFYFFVTSSSDGINPDEYKTDHVRYSSVIRQDEQSRTSIPDKSYSLFLSPLSADNKPVFVDVEIKDVESDPTETNQIERRFARWTFTAKAPSNSSVTAYILDKETQAKIKEYDLTFAQLDSLVFNPCDSLSPGSYTVALKKTGLAYSFFNGRYPHTGSSKMKGITTITQYTDFNTNPDIFDESHTIWNKIFEPDFLLPFPSLDSLYLRRMMMEPDDYSHERGKVLRRTVYGDDNALARIESYEYDRIDTSKYGLYQTVPSGPAGANFFVFIQFHKVPFTMFLPKKITVDEYAGNDIMTTKTKLSYNKYGYCSEQKTSMPDSSVNTVSYKYIADEASKYS